MTGSVASANVLQVNVGSGPQEVGNELELAVRDEVLYARVTDRASTIGIGSVVTVQGTFEHIDDYEVDEFPNSGQRLVDRRGAGAGGRGLVDLGPPCLNALTAAVRARI